VPAIKTLSVKPPTPSSKAEKAHRAPPSRTPDPEPQIALMNKAG
jgi:hypothetical protein